jgi:hypothetical protein
MQPNSYNDGSKPRTKNAFTLMNNVRDHCEQSDAKKLLLLVLATYCNGDGICYPSNKKLSNVTRKSRRTVQRMLKELAADGELEILSHGGGQTKRVLCLVRYAEDGDTQMSRGGDTQMSRGVVTPHGAKRARTDIDNNQEQPSDGIACGNSTANGAAKSVPKSEKNFGKDYQNHADAPAQSHVKWAEFAEWCRSEGAKRGKGGQPTEAGFWKWLCGQAPQWHKRVRQNPNGEEGYVLDGKFLTPNEAKQRAVQDPKLLDEGKFRKAIKRDGKVQPCA